MDEKGSRGREERVRSYNGTLLMLQSICQPEFTSACTSPMFPYRLKQTISKGKPVFSKMDDFEENLRRGGSFTIKQISLQFFWIQK